MKTLRIIFIGTISFLSIQLNGQIKLFSNGAVGLGSTVPSGFSASFYGRYFFIGSNGYNGFPNNMIKIDCGNSNPRIWSPSNSIAFYNNDGGNFIDIQVRTCYQNSDVNAKTNINTLSNGLTTIKKLRGVTFNWKNDGMSLNKPQSTSKKLEYGLIAQEIEKVVPDLVITNDSTKGKMVSYTGIIPILIEAIKDLSEQVEDQKKQIESLKSEGSNLKNAQVNNGLNAANASASISQNAPNPFTQNTVIHYYLPDEIQNADLYIYNMNGLQIKSIHIQSKGNGSVTIHGSELKPGMYIYTLIADGQEVDTKRMILTN